MKRNFIYELMTLHSQGIFSWWGLCLHFLKKSSITYYIQYYDSDLSLATLTTLFCKATHKNTFFSDYFDYADLHEIVSSLITLTTLMFKVTWKIVLSLNSLTSLFSIPGWRINSITNYAAYADFRAICKKPVS